MLKLLPEGSEINVSEEKVCFGQGLVLNAEHQKQLEDLGNEVATNESTEPTKVDQPGDAAGCPASATALHWQFF